MGIEQHVANVDEAALAKAGFVTPIDVLQQFGTADVARHAGGMPQKHERPKVQARDSA